MKITPHELNDMLVWLKKKYDIIRLEDLPQRLKNNHKRKFVIFTFDDGYKDNLTKALPIFKLHNVPFTIFLTTDFMDRKALLWWYILEDILLENNELLLDDGRVFDIKTLKQKEETFLKLRLEILKFKQNELRQKFETMFKNYNIDWENKCNELSLNWNDANILSNESLVTLGGHTKHHYNLQELPSVYDVKNEIELGNLRMEENKLEYPKTFAYPYGIASIREFNAVKSMEKIHIAVCANGGPVTEFNDNVYSIPRIMVEPNFKYSSLLKLNNACVL